MALIDAYHFFDSKNNLDIRVNVGDKFINESNGVVARVIKISKGEILTEQLKDGKRTYDITFDLSWLMYLLNDGTLKRIS